MTAMPWWWRRARAAAAFAATLACLILQNADMGDVSHSGSQLVQDNNYVM